MTTFHIPVTTRTVRTDVYEVEAGSSASAAVELGMAMAEKRAQPKFSHVLSESRQIGQARKPVEDTGTSDVHAEKAT